MPTQVDRELNIKRVYESVIECIREYGINRMTQKQIAQKAGLTTRSLQRYFPSMEEMIVDVSIFLVIRHCTDLYDKFCNYSKQNHTGLEEVMYWLRLHEYLINEGSNNLVIILDADFYLKRYSVYKLEELGYIPIVKKTNEVLRNSIKKGILDQSIKSNIDANLKCALITNTFRGLLQLIERYSHEEFILMYGVSPKQVFEAYINELKNDLEN